MASRMRSVTSKLLLLCSLVDLVRHANEVHLLDKDGPGEEVEEKDEEAAGSGDQR